MDLTKIPEFEEFPKIARLSRDIVITEKIDGTNGCVLVTENGDVIAGSRTRWITPEDDNHGFAKWVSEHADELRIGLGVGRHFGEWWGQGIQRGYGQDHKRFSLFNTSRWLFPNARPECCSCVPVLHRGIFDSQSIQYALEMLVENGSIAAPGFMRPEGIVIFHTAANICFKKTIEKDEQPKSMEK